MEARDWISLGILLLMAGGTLVACIRYIDSQIGLLKLALLDRTLSVDKEMADKISIGEFNRRLEDLERRIRLVERWQDHANGRYRTPEGDHYG